MPRWAVIDLLHAGLFWRNTNLYQYFRLYLRNVAWVLWNVTFRDFVLILHISMGLCKKEVTLLLTHWCYVFLALTHRYIIWYYHNSLSYDQYYPVPLRWRHNGRNGDSDHQPHDCLLNRLFRRRSKKTSKLHVTGLCAGPVNSPHKWPVTRKMFPFDDVIMTNLGDTRGHGINVNVSTNYNKTCENNSFVDGGNKREHTKSVCIFYGITL